MTKLDLSQFKPIPGFDCVKWKRERQAEIYEETKHMTPEEVSEYFRKGAERFDADIERRRAERRAAEAQSNESVVRRAVADCPTRATIAVPIPANPTPVS